MMRFRSKFIISLSVFVGLALMVGVVYAGRWISVGDSYVIFQLEKACTDGFQITGAYRLGAPPYDHFPSIPVSYSVYARGYPESSAPQDPDRMALNPPYLTPTPILAQGAVTLNNQSSALIIDNLNDGSYNDTTTYWGTTNIPWDIQPNISSAYPYISVFWISPPMFVGNFTAIQNCYLFPPDAQDDRFSTRRNTQLALSAGMALANDSDPNGNPFSIVSYTPPAHGRIIRTSPLMGYYIPNTNFVGIDTATYTIQDSTGATDTATLTFEVRR